jgi:hypothetical protein
MQRTCTAEKAFVFSILFCCEILDFCNRPVHVEGEPSLLVAVSFWSEPNPNVIRTAGASILEDWPPGRRLRDRL